MPDSAPDPTPAAAEPEWQVTLRPHRSLPPSGFLIVMLVLAAVSFVSGIVFVAIGAWPVMGFFGLDVLLVYFAFRLNYRGARMTETLSIAAGQFLVDRVNPWGERRHWSFQAFWLRVRLEAVDEESNRLLVTSHGRSLVLAGFLSPQERCAVAADLEAALDRHRRGV